jgi:hypothetical protein
MNVIRNYRNWRRFRKTVNELSRLTNAKPADPPRRALSYPELGFRSDCRSGTAWKRSGKAR